MLQPLKRSEKTHVVHHGESTSDRLEDPQILENTSSLASAKMQRWGSNCTTPNAPGKNIGRCETAKVALMKSRSRDEDGDVETGPSTSNSNGLMFVLRLLACIGCDMIMAIACNYCTAGSAG